MLSRIAASSGRLWQTPLAKNRLLVVVAQQKSFASAAEKAPASQNDGNETKYDDFLIFRPPQIPVNKVVTVQTVEECRGEGSLADQLSIRFGPNMPTIEDDKKPERDVVNFPRPVRLEEPEGTRLLIVPETWFQFFYPKTGYTGPYLFFGGVLSFLLSKEWMIIEHEMVVGGTLALLATVFLKNYGKPISDYLEGINEVEGNLWEKWQNGTIKTLDQFITLEKTFQESLKGQGILFEAKRENINLQREAEYRRRLMEVHNEVKRKLDYQIATQNASKQFAQKHMVSWIIDNVVKGISAQQEKEALVKCISDLKALAIKRPNVI